MDISYQIRKCANYNFPKELFDTARIIPKVSRATRMLVMSVKPTIVMYSDD